VRLHGNHYGANIVFNNDVIIVGEVELHSSTDIWDFKGEVFDEGTFLTIAPTLLGREMIIGLSSGPGILNADAFSNYAGTLILGGYYSPDSTSSSLLDGTVLGVSADVVTFKTNFKTAGSLLVLGSQIDFAPDSGGDMQIQAGNPHDGEIVFMALGTDLGGQSSPSSLFSWGNVPIDGVGNIDPQQRGLLTLTSGSASFLAAGALLNQINIVMDLDGGPVAVAQGSPVSDESFNVRSNAQSSLSALVDSTLVGSLSGLLGIGSVQAAYEETRPTFPNPTAFLSMMEAISFVDSSLFEEDLSLFGTIGNGIAMSLDQCEEAEGCAPTVTAEELAGLISALKERIDRLQTLISSGSMEADEGRRLIVGYEQQLENFQRYQVQLQAYLEKRESDEFGDDMGDEFEDVFEAEEVPEPAAAESNDPAEELPLDEPTIEVPTDDGDGDDLGDAPAELEFEDLDESAEAFDSEPASQPEPPSIETPTPVPAGSDGDFEELDDEFDEMLLNQLLDPENVNQLVGMVRIDDSGDVMWSGNVLLPTLHRRF